LEIVMAAAIHSMKSVLHNENVNGCSALSPSVDDALVILEQAHAVLMIANAAREDAVLNDQVLASAYSAAETLLEHGIRAGIQGHRDLLAQGRGR
jgi:hypothetical protein